LKDEDNRKKKAVAVIAVIVIVLVVWFLSIHHEMDIEVEGEGTVSPDGATVGHLGSVTLEFVPADGWALKEVLLDGSPAELTDGKLVLKWVVSNHHIKAVFVETAESYSLTVTSNGQGSVTPSGTTAYPAGSEVSVVATPDDGYVIDDVKVDGQSVGSKNIITLTMDSDHSVEVVFRTANDSSSGTTPADPWVDISVDVQIITTGADFGTVEPSGQVRVAYGGSLTITVTLNDGYSMVSVEVDGKPYGASSVFTVENITADISVDITVAHTVSEYTVTASASSGGSITPSGKISVAEGQDLTFAISPNSGYKLSSLLVDGKSVGSGLASYTLKNVTADITVCAVFESTSPSPGPGPSPQPVKTLESITIEGYPTSCAVGQELDTSRMVVTAHYSDGSSSAVTGYSVSHESFTSVGQYTVTVSYQGKTATFAVDVSAEQFTVTFEASEGGSVSPLSITVSAGTIPSLSGNVLSIDGSTIAPTAEPKQYIFGSWSRSDGKDVSEAIASDVTFTASFLPLTGISAIQEPTKTAYYAGEVFVPAGMKIQAVYGSGAGSKTAEVPICECTISPDRALTTTDSEITVSWQGKTCSVDVVVPELKSIEITKEPSVKTFAKGDTISLDGMEITARYADSQYDRKVETYTCSPASFDAVGEQKVTITYREGSVEKTTTLDVIIVDKDGFTATVVEYSGKKVVNGTIVSFDQVLSTRLSAFSFDMGNTVPGIVQTITVKVRNDTGTTQEICVYVSDLVGDDELAQQIRLSSGKNQSTVKDAASRGEFVILGEIPSGAEKTFTLTIEFVEGPDNNLAMGKSLTFKLGVFAGQKSEGS